MAPLESEFDVEWEEGRKRLRWDEVRRIPRHGRNGIIADLLRNLERDDEPGRGQFVGETDLRRSLG